jgi:hypothetical protein
VTFDDFGLDVVRQVVEQLGASFYTNDVWDHPTMRQRHRPPPDEEHTYRRLVGRYLSMNRHNLALHLAPRGFAGRGRLWERVSPTSQPS